MTGFIIKPQLDIPVDSAQLLGHLTVIQNLKNFVESDNIIAPLSIAIHGEWGSGKTSIMKTLEKAIDKTKFDTIFFEAWKFEYSNPSLALVTTISEKYSSAAGDARAIIEAAGYILADKFLGIDLKKAIDIIRGSKDQVENLSKRLEELIKNKLNQRRLIIIIDDLDRCDVENTLQLLALMKLFLSIPNCICIAAVDFKRLKQAWMQKYGIYNDGVNAGIEYLDKIFQIRVELPVPTNEMIKEYIQTLVSDIPEDLLGLFSEFGSKNPRSIKKMLNLISYRKAILNSDLNDISASLWTLLEEIISHRSLIYFYYLLKEVGKSLGSAIKNDGDNWVALKGAIQRKDANITEGPNDRKLSTFFSKSKLLVDKKGCNIQDLDRDFEILQSITNYID